MTTRVRSVHLRAATTGAVRVLSDGLYIWRLKKFVGTDWQYAA